MEAHNSFRASITNFHQEGTRAGSGAPVNIKKHQEPGQAQLAKRGVMTSGGHCG
jgi:hypothetical protein